MEGGTQLVETLKKLGYPKASKLNGEDFDWLFETGEDRYFLHWFCTSLNKQHLLDEEEVIAFENLKKSGKTMLDEESLAEVLKAYQNTELKMESATQEKIEIEKLEEEIQSLKKMKNLKVQRRNKLQVMATVSRSSSLKLCAEEQLTAKDIKDKMEILGAENAKFNRELQSLTETVKRLTDFFCNVASSSSGSLKRMPVFLSHLSLDKYLHLEEHNTKALVSYAKKQFFEGITDLVESSNEENFQLLDVSRNSFCGEGDQVQEERRKEMARLQFAYIVAQHQLVEKNAEEQSILAGLNWVKENFVFSPRAMLNGDDYEFKVKFGRLKKELQSTEEQVESLRREKLSATLRENAQSLNVPVVKGDFDLQIARQDYYMSGQDEVCIQLLEQKASFELLQLAYEMELRKYRQFHKQLEEMVLDLVRSRSELASRLETFSDPALSKPAKQRSIIDSKDFTFNRLYEMLVENTDGKEQLFRTYECLDQAAQKLQQDILSLTDHVAASNKEQSLLLSKMESDLDVLRNTNYCGLKQIVLTPQVCLTKQEHFINSQELGETIINLDSQLTILNQLMLEIINDVKAKNTILEHNKLLQMERELYVYFFQDENYLKSIVEELENKVRSLATGHEN
ncbi:HAUS augmin-like complex subunit 3 isoform X1 [Polypterus senegalus]|uniref:HAUS augmin-like complex subunit 3 isoform X1 n=1 Tax=Polypterus senegalus TaxID=55291 RepID=UPI0019631EDF|nr:HAUS augmin-like complex subunit 3 isoform X1 [Polypterus senegalus]